MHRSPSAENTFVTAAPREMPVQGFARIQIKKPGRGLLNAIRETSLVTFFQRNTALSVRIIVKDNGKLLLQGINDQSLPAQWANKPGIYLVPVVESVGTENVFTIHFEKSRRLGRGGP
jgi:hypothetical protein